MNNFIKHLLCDYRLYLFLALVSIIVGSGKRYINIFNIVKKYYKVVIDKSWGNFFAFICAPFCLALSVNFKKTIDNDMLNIIMVTISILMSAFFAYLTYFHDREANWPEKPGNYNLKKQKKTYFCETKAVASYEILLSILILLLSFIFPLFSESVQRKVSAMIYFSFFHLLMNLFMLLKRYDSSLQDDT